jgi:metallo-beta-lactamase family protein
LTATDGLSGHASRHGLRQFARDISPDTIALVHGPKHAQTSLTEHLAQNVSGVEQVTRSLLLTPIPVTQDTGLDTASVSPDQYDTDHDSISDQLEHLHELVGNLGVEVADARTGDKWTEAELREMMREEIQNVVDYEGDQLEPSVDD